VFSVLDSISLIYAKRLLLRIFERFSNRSQM